MVPPPPSPLRRPRANDGGYPLVAPSNDGVLPVDLLQEVLLRLPARPLCRLRPVCRPWCALLSDNPSFAAAHAARHPAPHVAVAARGRLNAYGRELVDVSLVDASSGDVVKRVCAGRCDRPAEVSTHGGMALLIDNNRLLRVLDPASGAVPVVPDYEINHPTNCSFTLGRTASTGEYKVMRITKDEELKRDEQQVCSVLTLGGDGVNGGRVVRWRKVPSQPYTVSTSRRFVAVVGGVAYFVLLYEFKLRRSDWIAAFDLEAEQWRPDLVGGPPETADDPLDVTATLAELRGSLVVAHDDHRAGILDLWFLLAVSGDSGKVGPQHWSKLYTVTMPYHALGQPWLWDAESAEPVVVLDDGRIVFWVWASGSSGHGRGVIRVYDPSTGGQTDVAAMAGVVHVGVYTGNLLLPLLKK